MVTNVDNKRYFCNVFADNSAHEGTDENCSSFDGPLDCTTNRLGRQESWTHTARPRYRHVSRAWILLHHPCDHNSESIYPQRLVRHRWSYHPQLREPYGKRHREISRENLHGAPQNLAKSVETDQHYAHSVCVLRISSTEGSHFSLALVHPRGLRKSAPHRALHPFQASIIMMEAFYVYDKEYITSFLLLAVSRQ